MIALEVGALYYLLKRYFRRAHFCNSVVNKNEIFDIVVNGAGPSGLACAVDAEKHYLHYLVIEKGCLVNSAYHFHTNETNVPGIYDAGVITAGSDASKVFIENSRMHGTNIIGNILNDS